MKAVIQRVRRASVEVDGELISHIDEGLLVLLGIAKHDGETDVRYIVEKLMGIRIFNDAEGKMNRAIGEIGGKFLIVSQFTLLGDTRKGRRPSFDGAAPTDQALKLYHEVVASIRGRGLCVETGRFGAHMHVLLDNDGPVTFLLDSQADLTKG